MKTLYTIILTHDISEDINDAGFLHTTSKLKAIYYAWKNSTKYEYNFISYFIPLSKERGYLNLWGQSEDLMNWSRI